MKKIILSFVIFGIVLSVKAQDEIVNGILTVTKSTSQAQKPYSLLKLKINNGVYDRNNGPAVEFSTNIGLAKIAGVDERNNNNSMYAGGLVFKTRLHNQGDDSGFYERMRIIANGNVGIGTSSPETKLHVNGRLFLGMDASGSGTWYKASSGNNWFAGLNNENKWRVYKDENRFLIDGNGNIGIGTNSPNSLLELYKNEDIGNSPMLKIKNESDVYKKDIGPSIEFSTNIGLAKILGVDERNGNTSTYQGGLVFKTRLHTQGNDSGFYERMRIVANGNVGIGTSKPDMKLTVKGNIHAEEVKIDLNIPAPDYVFQKNYNLRSIEEVEKFIILNSHLPEIPSAKEFKENGLLLAEMDMNLLKKIEELTLYTIHQQKEIETLKKENKELKSLSNRLTEIEKLLKLGK